MLSSVLLYRSTGSAPASLVRYDLIECSEFCILFGGKKVFMDTTRETPQICFFSVSFIVNYGFWESHAKVTVHLLFIYLHVVLCVWPNSFSICDPFSDRLCDNIVIILLNIKFRPNLFPFIPFESLLFFLLSYCYKILFLRFEKKTEIQISTVTVFLISLVRTF